MTIPVFKPSIKRVDMNAVLTCMVSDTIGPGKVSERFSRGVARYLGLTGGVALREYNRALRLAIDCLELAAHEKVILSALSPSLYHAIVQEKNLQPLYADVEEETGCVSCASIEQLMKEEPSAILVHAPLGFVPDMQTIRSFGLPIIEDISQSLGGNTVERTLGTYGNYVVLATESDNIITTGGGALVLAGTKSDVRKLKQYAEKFTEDSYLADMNGALGLVQLESLEQYIDRRKEIAQVYSRAIMKSKHKTLYQKDDSENIYYSFPVYLTSGMKEVMQYAKKKKVQTLPAFRGSAAEEQLVPVKTTPVAHTLHLRSLLFPLYPMLGKQNIEHIAKVLSSLP
jgi:dTDP-4-amino-4,6-dideoxygalactose transaminase